MHQASSLGQRFEALQKAAGDARAKAIDAASKFEEYAQEVKKALGLGEEHAIDLTDENGGLVVMVQKGQPVQPAKK